MSAPLTTSIVSTAVVGLGRWGKNLVRVLDSLTDVPCCCHTGDAQNRAWLRAEYPDVSVTTAYQDILDDETIDAVAIATPIETHGDLAKRAIDAGKHVFVEKPMTETVECGRQLVQQANGRDVTVFVGYIYLYHPAIAELRDRTRGDPVLAAHFDWRKVGTFDEPLVENLVTHDVALTLDLVVADVDQTSVLDATEAVTNVDVLTASIGDGQRRSVFSVNRVSPMDTKAATFVTEAGDVYYWEGDALFVFDPDSRSFEVGYRSAVEPLKAEIRAFLESIETDRQPRTDAAFGLAVSEVTRQLSADL